MKLAKSSDSDHLLGMFVHNYVEEIVNVAPCGHSLRLMKVFIKP